jgi:ADP-ribosylglycohydrolase
MFNSMANKYRCKIILSVTFIMPNNINEDKYIGLFLLHALGDTLGFRNTEFDFFNDNKELESPLAAISEFIFEFIDLGGVNGIDIKDWIISDDTLYHIAIAKSILKFKGKFTEKFYIFTKRNMVKMHNIMINEQEKGVQRYPSHTTSKYIEKFTKHKDARFYKYDPATGGNGAAMRNLCIGLAFHKSDQLDMLIEMSINLSKLTHNSPYGYLAGFTSAYFVSLAIQEIPINKWPFLLIELLQSEKIKKYININENDEFMDYVSYIRYWRKYIDTRFIDEKPIKIRSTSNMIFRIKYYVDNFIENGRSKYLGNSGFCAMIMAYDSVLDCDGKWEKIIFYAILHFGDSDTVGAIAGGLYGALYGIGDVPQNMICCIEKKKQLLKLGKLFHEKFS